MKIRPLSLSAYASAQDKKTPAFGANVHAVVKSNCFKPGKCLDPLSDNSQYEKYSSDYFNDIFDYVKRVAVKKGLIKKENILDDISSTNVSANGEINVVVVDKTAKTFYERPKVPSNNKFSDFSVNPYELQKYHFLVKDDLNTAKIVVTPPKETICPMLTKLLKQNTSNQN